MLYDKVWSIIELCSTSRRQMIVDNVSKKSWRMYVRDYWYKWRKKIDFSLKSLVYFPFTATQLVYIFKFDLRQNFRFVNSSWQRLNQRLNAYKFGEQESWFKSQHEKKLFRCFLPISNLRRKKVLNQVLPIDLFWFMT